MNTLIKSITAYDDRLEEFTEKIIKISKQLYEAMCDKEDIENNTIAYFSRLVCVAIYRNYLDYLPDEFLRLVDRANDFWLYEYENEHDREIISSYSRIFQAVNMLDLTKAEISKEQKLKQSETLFENYQSILFVIYENPGITHSDLAKSVQMSVSNLSQKISRIEQEHFIFSKRSGSKKYYSLTTLGVSLVKRYLSKDTGENRTVKPNNYNTGWQIIEHIHKSKSQIAQKRWIACSNKIDHLPPISKEERIGNSNSYVWG